jgi:hypothetical protein
MIYIFGKRKRYIMNKSTIYMVNTLQYRQGQIYPMDVFKLGPKRSVGAEGRMKWEAKKTRGYRQGAGMGQ